MPPPAGRHPDPFSMVGKPLPTSLEAGNDITVIALWLGHEQIATTNIYLHADMTIKQQAIDKARPPAATPGRYQPPDALLAFLESL
jgi:integrase/recombinase XerD